MHMPARHSTPAALQLLPLRFDAGTWTAGNLSGCSQQFIVAT